MWVYIMQYEIIKLYEYVNTKLYNYKYNLYIHTCTYNVHITLWINYKIIINSKLDLTHVHVYIKIMS